MAKKGIQGTIQHTGALTRKAKAAGMSLSAYMAHPPKGIAATTRREINLAKTLKSFRRGK